jgi:hypothetical protein
MGLHDGQITDASMKKTNYLHLHMISTCREVIVIRNTNKITKLNLTKLQWKLNIHFYVITILQQFPLKEVEVRKL